MLLPPSLREAGRRGLGPHSATRSLSRDLFWCAFALLFIVGFVLLARPSASPSLLGRRGDEGHADSDAADACRAPAPGPREPSEVVRIVRRQVRAHIVFEDANLIAFLPQDRAAPVHFVVAPKKPLGSLEEAAACDAPLLGHMLLVARRVAREQGVRHGFRVVVNNGPDAGQMERHLRLHVFGNTRMMWPPGV